MKLSDRQWGRRHWLPILFRRTMRLRNLGPVVTFTFDDFPRTAYCTGGTILKSAGACATYYAAFGLRNTANPSGDQFTVDDLHRLTADGHELGSHTYHHVSSRNLSAGAFLQEVVEGREALRSVLGLAVSDNFAYPFGAVTAAAKRAVGRSMRSCRSSFVGVNGRVVDLNLLRANPLRGGAEQLDVVRRLVRITEEVGGWLIFYTHDVRDNPSPHGCTPALLESAVKLVAASSAKILTVGKVLEQAQGQSQAR